MDIKNNSINIDTYDLFSQHNNFQEPDNIQNKSLTLKQFQGENEFTSSQTNKQNSIEDSFSNVKQEIDLTIKRQNLKKQIIYEALNEKSDLLFNNKNLNYNYQTNKYQIYQGLLKKNYTIESYLAKGGQADVFIGYFSNDKAQKEECVFKIYFGVTDKEFEQEIDTMKSFEKPINIVRIIESVKIQDAFILILEKCQYSLQIELKIFQQKNIFPIEKLLQIIFDLLDGLIQMRIYTILHLDIKPANILITKEGNYCYSDFGISQNIKKNQQVEIQQMTKYYASPEQKNYSNSIDFNSDVYSLGKTLQKVLLIYKQTNSYLNKQSILEMIQNFQNIINTNMLQNQSNKRSNCQDLHKLFLQQIRIEEYQQLNQKYQQKLKQIIRLQPYDKKKDIPYILNIKLFYYLTIIHLMKNYKNINFYIASYFNEVVNCFLETGDYQNGLKYSLESLEMRKQIFQGNHIDIAQSQYNVGRCFIELGDNQNGLKYSLESLEMSKQIYQGNHLDIVASLNYVGVCYEKIGDYQNFLKYSLESLKMAKQIFQRNHPTIAIILNNIGLCYKNIGDNQNGFKYLLESLEIVKQTFQEIHPDIVSTLNNIGLCYQNLGEYQNALAYLLESLEMVKQIYQQNHPYIALIINNIGLCYSGLGDYQKGLKYQLKSFVINKQIFQGNHQIIASSLINVAMCYKNLGENQNGLKYSLKSLEMNKQIFQGDHPDFANSLCCVGVCYMHIGENKIGLKYLLKSLEMYKQLFQENHPHIASSLNNIGVCYKNLGENQNALKYSLESLNMRKQIFQGNHHHIQESLNNVGQYYLKLNDFQNSLKYLLKSKEMKNQILEGSHTLREQLQIQLIEKLISLQN